MRVQGKVRSAKSGGVHATLPRQEGRPFGRSQEVSMNGKAGDFDLNRSDGLDKGGLHTEPVFCVQFWFMNSCSCSLFVQFSSRSFTILADGEPLFMNSACS